MRVYDLARAVTGTGNQPEVELEGANRDEVLVQIEFTSTGSVTLEGRVDSGMSWRTIAGPYTTDTTVPVAYVPSLRLAIASNAGAITAKVVAG